MTQSSDEGGNVLACPEVFLGPTGNETEEFYTHQRNNPGLEKSDYLTWFQKRFNKEIELRRRRSDQPSDLEFMVIKKRSKYRERIGEESQELVSYSEANPSKTYRELAEWFQKKFNKEIDITAISRALKRQRNDSPEAALSLPPAKRGRRADGENERRSQLPLGSTVGSTPTFSVDMKPSSSSHTPQATPSHTPKSKHARLATPQAEDRLPPANPPTIPPPPPYHKHPAASPKGDKRIWLNPGAPPPPPGAFGSKRDEMRSPPRPLQSQPPPNHRMLRKTGSTPTGPPVALAPAPPPTSAPPQGRPPVTYPVPASGTPVAPAVAAPPQFPMREQLDSFHHRLATVDQQSRGLEEVRRQIDGDMLTMLAERAEWDRQWQAERESLLNEREHLIRQAQDHKMNFDRLQEWCEKVHYGNVELQEKEKFLVAERSGLLNKMTDKERKLAERDYQLANAKKVLRENGIDDFGSRAASVGPGDRKSRKELDQWVAAKFQDDREHDASLQKMMDGLENMPFKDFEKNVQALRDIILSHGLALTAKEEEWRRVVGSMSSGTPPAQQGSPLITPVDSQMEDADIPQPSRSPSRAQTATPPVFVSTPSGEHDTTPAIRTPSAEKTGYRKLPMAINSLVVTVASKPSSKAASPTPITTGLTSPQKTPISSPSIKSIMNDIEEQVRTPAKEDTPVAA